MDVTMLRAMPGITLMAPADQGELHAALALAVSLDGPSAIRYPRDETPEDLDGKCPEFKPGKARVLAEGTDGTFLCYGAILTAALSAKQQLSDRGLSIGLVNARFAKPMDEKLIGDIIATGKPLVVCEDHAAIGGFGSAVLEELHAFGPLETQVVRLGVRDRFLEHGGRELVLREQGLDPEGIAASLKAGLRRKRPAGAKDPAGRA